MRANDQLTEFTLVLDEVEKAALIDLLGRELRETHVEARRTESPRFQDEVHRHEAVIQGLIEKLRRP